MLSAAAGLLLALCVCLRFDGKLNDLLSGHPHYMRAVATALAEQFSKQTAGDYVILVAEAAAEDCRDLGTSNAPEFSDLIYVLSYSEQARSVCFTGYVPSTFLPNTTPRLLDPATSANYGRPLPAPVKGVPIIRTRRIFTDDFIALLDWHRPLKRENKTVLADRHFSSGPQISHLDVTLDLFAMRAAVAQRHDFVNRLLVKTFAFLSSLLLVPAAILLVSYSGFRRHCKHYSFDLSFSAFIVQNLEAIDEQAQRNWQALVQSETKERRSENICRRLKEEIRGKLAAFLDTAAQRAGILQCLERDDLDEMTFLLRDLQRNTSEKSPQERLGALLEPLKEYCTPEEFANCHRQAMENLEHLGFREAREFVVATNNMFRARAKAAAQENASEDLAEGSRR